MAALTRREIPQLHCDIGDRLARGRCGCAGEGSRLRLASSACPGGDERPGGEDQGDGNGGGKGGAHIEILKPARAAGTKFQTERFTIGRSNVAVKSDRVECPF